MGCTRKVSRHNEKKKNVASNGTVTSRQLTVFLSYARQMARTKRTDSRAEISPARLRQLSKAREAAVYSRRLKTRDRLTRELNDVNDWLSEYEGKTGTKAATPCHADSQQLSEALQLAEARAAEASERENRTAEEIRELKRKLQEATEQQAAADRAQRAAERAEKAANAREATARDAEAKAHEDASKAAKALAEERARNAEAPSRHADAGEGNVVVSEESLDAFCARNKGIHQVGQFCKKAKRPASPAFRGSTYTFTTRDDDARSETSMSSSGFDGGRSFARAQQLRLVKVDGSSYRSSLMQPLAGSSKSTQKEECESSDCWPL